MTLYLKYRPQKVSELDLTSVRETLGKILLSKNIPHAFLFSGPKGTGKTSSARILAKALNCEYPKNGEPCGKCDQCLSIAKSSNIDVIEMDAASNRGIDDIRVLRENIKLAPARAKRKIYIIDEAHMLTTEAANALLKTLEEPPAHVVFILATTNPEKLPSTISSRMTMVNFNKATLQEIGNKLQKISKEEEIKIDEKAIELIAQSADGSFRDAVKNLEMLSMQGTEITLELVNKILFQGNTLQIDKIMQFIVDRDSKQILEEIERVAKDGGSMKMYVDQIIGHLHKNLLESITKESSLSLSEISELITNLNNAKSQLSYSPIAQLPLELAILDWLKDKGKKKPEIVETEPQVVPSVPVAQVLEGEQWTQILLNVREKNASIEALLRSSKPMSFDGKTLTLGVYYKFHKERLEAGNNRQTLEDVLHNVYGVNVLVDCVLAQKPNIPVAPKEVVLEEPKKDIAQVAKEIFGA